MHSKLRRITTNGIQLRAFVDGDGPLVVLVHGFPESWYSWRQQLQPIVDAGFRVVAPDVRGCGGSDKPESVDAGVALRPRYRGGAQGERLPHVRAVPRDGEPLGRQPWWRELMALF